MNETFYVNDDILKDFVSCHRKAFLEEKELIKNGKKQGQEKEGFIEATYNEMKLVSRLSNITSMNEKKAVIIDIHSKTIRERHKISVSFLAFVMNLNGIHAKIVIKNTDNELREIHPRLERIESILSEMKKVFENDIPPDPTFSFACRNCPFHNECVSFSAKKGDISMINGIGEGRKRALQKAGYSTVEEVSHSDAQTLSRYMGISLQEAKRIILQAKSIKSSKWFLLSQEKKISAKRSEYFFDVEKGSDETYLFGILLKNGNNVIYKYFVMMEEEWEGEWENFLKFAKLYPRAPIYHYDVFDRKVIEKFGSLSQRSVKNILNRMKDLYDIVVHSFVLPVRFYSLKDVARTIGFEWRVNGYTGYEAMRALDEWKEKQDESLLQKIVLYNEDDCRALMAVKEEMLKITGRYRKNTLKGER